MIQITITRDSNGEYRVPTDASATEGAAYYTDDRDDAIDTARDAFADDVIIKHRNVETHETVPRRLVIFSDPNEEFCWRATDKYTDSEAKVAEGITDPIRPGELIDGVEVRISNSVAHWHIYAESLCPGSWNVYLNTNEDDDPDGEVWRGLCLSEAVKKFSTLERKIAERDKVK